MINKNSLYKHSKLSEQKFRRILLYFVHDLMASQTGRLTGVSIRSVNDIYLKLRRRIAEDCEQCSPVNGIVEVDESYFGPRRVRGKRGRGASGKTIVFGLFKRNGKVYTEIVPDCSKSVLQKLIRGHIDIESVIHSDGWPGYDGLVDLGYEKHFRVHHGKDQFADGLNHINGIESFWGYAKRRLVQFNGVPGRTFYLHLKETEFRFNNRNTDLFKNMLNLLRAKPI